MTDSVMEYFFCIDADGADKRADIFLHEYMPKLSRSFIQKLMEQGRVKVNDKPCRQNYRLRDKDVLTVSLEEPKEIAVEPEEIPLDILYEDTELIVVNKPKGMVVHPAPSHYSGTLVNALLFHCKGQLSGINGMLRPGIVHRIDKDTSGVLVAAKSNAAHDSLSRQLAEHSMARKYHAVVYNNIKEDEGLIERCIDRHPVDRKKMTVTDKCGRYALTRYKVLERFGKYSYIECRLETGRTHQIRVHMASIGHPLLGDNVYGAGKQNEKYQGQVLHAKELGFIHPLTNEFMSFETPLPDYFCKLLENLRV